MRPGTASDHAGVALLATRPRRRDRQPPGPRRPGSVTDGRPGRHSGASALQPTKLERTGALASGNAADPLASRIRRQSARRSPRGFRRSRITAQTPRSPCGPEGTKAPNYVTNENDLTLTDSPAVNHLRRRLSGHIPSLFDRSAATRDSSSVARTATFIHSQWISELQK